MSARTAATAAGWKSARAVLLLQFAACSWARVREDLNLGDFADAAQICASVYRYDFLNSPMKLKVNFMIFNPGILASCVHWQAGPDPAQGNFINGRLAVGDDGCVRRARREFRLSCAAPAAPRPEVRSSTCSSRI